MLRFKSVQDIAAYVARQEQLRAGDKSPRRRHDITIQQDLAEMFKGSSGSALIRSDMPHTFFIVHDGVEMEVYGGGPTLCAYELEKAVIELGDGDAVYTPYIDDYNYGCHLRFTRTGNAVELHRTRGARRSLTVLEGDPTASERTPLPGPPSITCSWEEFVEGTQEYHRWHLEEHVPAAPWLQEAGFVKEWLREHNN